MNFDEIYQHELWDVGVRYPWPEGRIEDIELANTMALAEDPHMEKVIALSPIRQELSSKDPEETYRRAGRKAIILSELAAAHISEVAHKNFTYKGWRVPILDNHDDTSTMSVEQYLNNLNNIYEYDRAPKNTRVGLNINAPNRLTNGFVESLATEIFEKRQNIANFAGKLVCYKYIQGKNVEILEQFLSEKDQDIFASEKDLPKGLLDTFEEMWGDKTAAELEVRALELNATFRNKLFFKEVAKIFGNSSLSDLTKEKISEFYELISTKY